MSARRIETNGADRERGAPRAPRGADPAIRWRWEGGAEGPAEASAGDLLRSLREASGLTQGDLASLLGVSQQAVSQAERPASNPTLRFLQAWARACGAAIALTLSAGAEAPSRNPSRPRRGASKGRRPRWTAAGRILWS